MHIHLFNVGSCENEWEKDGFLCYKLFLHKYNGFMYDQAWHMCGEVGTELIMRKLLKWPNGSVTDSGG